MKNALSTNTMLTAGKLPELLRSQQCRPQRRKRLSKLVENLRQRNRVPKRPGGLDWAKHDWEQLIRNTGTVQEAWSSDALDLFVVNAKISVKCTCIVFVCPKLIKAVFNRLANKEYVKLCGGGAYKIIKKGWVVLTMGGGGGR